MTIALAFYKGRGNWIDSVIRLVTRSQYSHVEYVPDYWATGVSQTCYSSSQRDGGVRSKTIDLHSGNWEVVPVPWMKTDATRMFERLAGAKYDYLGILFSQFFTFRRQSSSRWFCSEICAAALNFEAPETHSPGSLFLTLQQSNRLFGEAYNRGWQDAEREANV